MFVIENSIPAPVRRQARTGCRHTGRPAKYPFERMNVGDSFHAENGKHDTSEITRNRLATAANRFVYHAGLDWKFATRVTETGARVWRIK